MHALFIENEPEHQAETRPLEGGLTSMIERVLPTQLYAYGSGDLSDFNVLVSYRFQRHIREINDGRFREDIYRCIVDLITGRAMWPQRQVKKPKRIPHDRKVRSARINEADRLVFEGPLRAYDSSKPTLFIHDFCRHDSVNRVIKRVLKQEVDEESLIDLEPGEIEDKNEEISLSILGSDVTAFAKPIPPLAFADPDKIDEILRSQKANIHLTEKQLAVLRAPRPLLINGCAGTGKTTVLCHLLAWSLQVRKQWGYKGPMLYLSYNRRLVEQAEKDVREILRTLHLLDDDSVGEVEFVPFQKFLLRYVTDQERFREENYMSFGRFKRLYDIYRRGTTAARSISPELAWYIIRSIMKGACLPQFDDNGILLPGSRSPLTKERYVELSRKRKEIEESLYDEMYQIGQWYQNEIILAKEMWDDQDIAWAALKWVMEEQRKTTMQLFAEIFVDEVQDLTELEFAFLVSLCSPPARYSRESVLLALAGDPLQTIDPTGFRWSVVSEHVYKLGNVPVERHELEENWRSDRRIVDLANCIQKIRGFYLQQDLPTQAAFEKEEEGDIPHVIAVETEDEIDIVARRLEHLPDRSAVIVWDEEDESILQLLQRDPVLSKLLRGADNDNPDEINTDNLDEIMADINLYKVSESKGLEFRRVILYRFGEHPDVKQWWKWMQTNQHADLQTQIPLLYFLNRLYISVTRAESYLFIVDSPEAVQEFWSKFSEVLRFVRRAEAVQEFQAHIAFHESPNWEKWGDRLFENAEKREDVRDYERAKSAYMKAGADQKAKKVQARIAELYEDWPQAGHLYFDIAEYGKAGSCFEKCGNWLEALTAYQNLPSTPERNRRIAICHFRHGRTEPQRKRDVALQFLEYVKSDSKLGKEVLQETAATLGEVKELSHAAEIFERLYKEHKDNQAGVEAGRCWVFIKKYAKALDVFRRCSYYGTEYVTSLQRQAELLEQNREYSQAVELYSELTRWDREAPIHQGRCLYRVRKYREALDAFNRGNYQGREADLCRAELGLQEGKILDAIRLLSRHGEYPRVLEAAEGFSDIEILPYVAEAHYRLGHHKEAIEQLKHLVPGVRKDKDFQVLNRYYIWIGDCYRAQGQLRDAYTNYREGRAYEKALGVAKSLEMPGMELKQLEAEDARERADFTTAIRIWEELGDPRKVDELTGHRLKYQQDYLGAVDHFIRAQSWGQVCDCIENGFFHSEQDRIQAKIKLIRAAQSINEQLRPEDRDRVMCWIREIREDEEWMEYILPQEMSLAYEKCAFFVDAATFYESYWKEQWAREGWLRVKEAQCRYHETRSEQEKADKIRRRIRDQVKKWGLDW